MSTPKDRKRFIELPYRLNKGDSNWIAPLRGEQCKSLDAQSNRTLRHCEHQLFLLVDGGKVLGRISAVVDKHAVKRWGKRIGMFGHLVCIDNEAAMHRLLRSAANYLVGKRCVSMRGPWSFASQEWGLLMDGFKPPPVVGTPYNAPYYAEHLESSGMNKVADLLAYEANSRQGFEFPDRGIQMTDTAERRYDIRVRGFDYSKSAEELEILTDISERAQSSGWGLSPTIRHETRALRAGVRQKATICIAEDGSGQAIGYCLAAPDSNMLLRGGTGSLFPSLWWKLRSQQDQIRDYRMWSMAVVPEYQGKSIDALLFRRVYESLQERNPRIELNAILEEDKRANNAMERMGLEQIRRYRVFEREL
ncbi:MAG: hypothetical protein GY811_19475 [Myxococcales bacterium]|nr:hypothetical protein [Myxococcales bacterium]